MNYQRWGLIDTSDIFGPRFDRIQHFLFDARSTTQNSTKETVKAKKQAKTAAQTGLESPVQWSVKQDDFFPLF
jgi:hypothetical protein